MASLLANPRVPGLTRAATAGSSAGTAGVRGRPGRSARGLLSPASSVPRSASVSSRLTFSQRARLNPASLPLEQATRLRTRANTHLRAGKRLRSGWAPAWQLPAPSPSADSSPAAVRGRFVRPGDATATLHLPLQRQGDSSASGVGGNIIFYARFPQDLLSGLLCGENHKRPHLWRLEVLSLQPVRFSSVSKLGLVQTFSFLSCFLSFLILSFRGFFWFCFLFCFSFLLNPCLCFPWVILMFFF